MASFKQFCMCRSQKDLPPKLYPASSSRESDSLLDESFDSDCSSTPPELFPYHQVIEVDLTSDATDYSSMSTHSSPEKESSKFSAEKDRKRAPFPLTESFVIDGELIRSFSTAGDMHRFVATQQHRGHSSKQTMDPSICEYDSACGLPFTRIPVPKGIHQNGVKRKLDTAAIKQRKIKRVTRAKVSDSFDDSGFSEGKSSTSCGSHPFEATSASGQEIPVITISDSEDDGETAQELVNFLAKKSKTIEFEFESQIELSAVSCDVSGLPQEKNAISQALEPYVSVPVVDIISLTTHIDSQDKMETSKELVFVAAEPDNQDQMNKFKELLSMDASLETSKELVSVAAAPDNKHEMETSKELAYVATAPGFLSTTSPPKSDVIDGSIVIRPEESYCEDYDVPMRRKVAELGLKADCWKRFCSLGCICESLNSVRVKPEHCTFSYECMWNCQCENLGYKSKLRRRINSSTEKSESQMVKSKPRVVSDETSVVIDKPLPSTSQDRVSEKRNAVPPREVSKTLAIEPKEMCSKVIEKLDPANSQLVLYKPPSLDRPLVASSPPAQEIALRMEIDTQKEKIHDLGSQLERMQHEVGLLKDHLLVNNAAAQMLEVLPKLVETAKQHIDLLTTLKAEVPTKEEPQLPTSNVSATVESQPSKSEASTSVKKDESLPGNIEVAPIQPLIVKKDDTAAIPAITKDETTAIPAITIEKEKEIATPANKKNGPVMAVKKDEAAAERPHVNGVYLDCIPLDEAFLDRLAREFSNSTTGFIRQLMRKMFTFDYLTSRTYGSMEQIYRDAVIGATLKRFEKRRDKKGIEYRTTEEFIKRTISSEFSTKKNEKKLKGL